MLAGAITSAFAGEKASPERAGARAPSPAACNAVVTAAIGQVAMHRAAVPNWLKNVSSPDLVIYDYQASQRDEKTAWNWKPCDGIDLGSFGYTMSPAAQDLFDANLAARHEGHAE